MLAWQELILCQVSSACEEVYSICCKVGSNGQKSTNEI